MDLQSAEDRADVGADGVGRHVEQHAGLLARVTVHEASQDVALTRGQPHEGGWRWTRAWRPAGVGSCTDVISETGMNTSWAPTCGRPRRGVRVARRYAPIHGRRSGGRGGSVGGARLGHQHDPQVVILLERGARQVEGRRPDGPARAGSTRPPARAPPAGAHRPRSRHARRHAGPATSRGSQPTPPARAAARAKTATRGQLGRRDPDRGRCRRRHADIWTTLDYVTCPIWMSDPGGVAHVHEAASVTFAVVPARSPGSRGRRGEPPPRAGSGPRAC